MEKVTVSADALKEVLTALNGPAHYIRELQALRDPPFGSDNPINILCAEYNGAVDKHNDTAVHVARLTADFERECADTDRLLQTGIGWTPDRTRTDGGSLKVDELAEAMRAMMAPGSGG